MSASKRPRFFNLTQISLPVGAVTSITHRVTGLLLVLGTPLAMRLLELSVGNEQGYAQVSALFGSVLFRAVAILFIWALTHHLLAGVRHLLMDAGVGSRLITARASAWAINLTGAAVILLAAGAML